MKKKWEKNYEMPERVKLLKNMPHIYTFIIYTTENIRSHWKETHHSTLAFPGMENGCATFIKEILIG